MASHRLGETLLPKKIALPVFCSDPISSVAYATEQIVLVLGTAGTAAYLGLAAPISIAVALLLAVVVASYRQTCYAYPSGGGAYVVSKENLGQNASLTAAAALLVDYVMTVAVSVVSGVVAIISALPSLAPYAVELSVGFIAVLALVNLRGVKESGTAFAFPTYAFVGLTMLLLASGAYRELNGGIPEASSAHLQLQHTAQVGGIFTVLLCLRAFASGCTALTGVEAISNGVPAFKKPQSKNAATTLLIMGALAITMFSGITALALATHARAYHDGNPSVISQIAETIWGRGVLFYAFQAATAGILVLAANTAFNGFPTLASILARDRFLPHQLHNRGDRLAFSNGILLLAGVSAALVIGFDANIDKLIQLYIVGVFTSFTLSQVGMVRHWRDELGRTGNPARRRTIHRSQLINGTGAVVTALVLVIVVRYKFLGGAYLAIAAMVAIFLLMRAIRRHYDAVELDLQPEPGGIILPSRNHAIVLVSKLHAPTLRALAYAKATRPSRLTALTVAVDKEEERKLRADWDERGVDIPLTIVASPFREITRPVLEYISHIRRENPRDVVTVFIPEYVVGHWWEHLLHNQSALRLKGRLLYQPGVMVTSVPYQLRSSRDGLAGTDDLDDEVLPQASSMR
ncbi:amino acid transporter [Phycicoccus badiiscoriae]|uniref:Amino acid transporter n=1 Tax=Pedococcus badiiscoriae TaxID=642776 RepID=A0A852WDI9_9MICO|nr:APC family permease [Pedococcus badiiscoriae]NYG07337.1 amino acid transporter [Pedococcus badiiscoriae]